MPGSPVWDTPATRRSRALGGLALERPFPAEGRAWVFTGKAPAALTSRPLALRPGRRYRLSLWLRRESFVNDHYLWLDFLGAEHRLDAHCVVGGWQKLSVTGIAPPSGRAAIVIRNHSPSRLLLGRARLEPLPLAPPPSPATHPVDRGGFPVGAYLNGAAQLAPAAACGLDTVILGASPGRAREVLARARALGLGVILHAPLQNDRLRRLIVMLKPLPPELRPRAFYLKDEPEIKSVPPARLLAARELLRASLPWARVVTAMVRPGQVARYAAVYDAVFMDQYPVPSQPLNWLADSIITARGLVRPGGQVWAVVQAFGGGRFRGMGWPRPPTPAELNALAASALAAGAQGILFYNWRHLARDAALRPAVCKLTARLKQLGPWLPLAPGLPPGMALRGLGRVKSDPGGSPAVRVGWSRNGQGLLVLAVNTTPHTVEVALLGAKGEARQPWRGGRLPAVGGQLRALMAPREVRAWLFPAGD
jgi:hypothetical protein